MTLEIKGKGLYVSRVYITPGSVVPSEELVDANKKLPGDGPLKEFSLGPTRGRTYEAVEINGETYLKPVEDKIG